ELTTAILGLRMSSSLSPSARHCARRTAQRGEPSSKLLRSFVVVMTRLSVGGSSGRGRPEPALVGPWKRVTAGRAADHHVVGKAAALGRPARLGDPPEQQLDAAPDHLV